jgi:hypothetical protein
MYDGAQPYLPNAQQASQNLAANFNAANAANYDAPRGSYIGSTGFGTSKYDEDLSLSSETAGSLDYMRGDVQGSGDKIANGLVKLVGKTALETGGGIFGWLYGTAAAIGDGDLRSFFDNDFNNAVERGRTSLDENFKHYKTEQEANSKFGGGLNFWFDTFMGGASFLAGAVLTEMAYSAATAATFGAAAPIQAAKTAELAARGANMLGRGAKAAQRLGGTIDKLSESSRLMGRTPTWLNKLAGTEARAAKV